MLYARRLDTSLLNFLVWAVQKYLFVLEWPVLQSENLLLYSRNFCTILCLAKCFVCINSGFWMCTPPQHCLKYFIWLYINEGVSLSSVYLWMLTLIGLHYSKRVVVAVFYRYFSHGLFSFSNRNNDRFRVPFLHWIFPLFRRSSLLLISMSLHPEIIFLFMWIVYVFSIANLCNLFPLDMDNWRSWHTSLFLSIYLFLSEYSMPFVLVSCVRFSIYRGTMIQFCIQFSKLTHTVVLIVRKSTPITDIYGVPILACSILIACWPLLYIMEQFGWLL